MGKRKVPIPEYHIGDEVYGYDFHVGLIRFKIEAIELDGIYINYKQQRNDGDWNIMDERETICKANETNALQQVIAYMIEHYQVRNNVLIKDKKIATLFFKAIKKNKLSR